MAQTGKAKASSWSTGQIQMLELAREMESHSLINFEDVFAKLVNLISCERPRAFLTPQIIAGLCNLISKKRSRLRQMIRRFQMIRKFQMIRRFQTLTSYQASQVTGCLVRTRNVLPRCHNLSEDFGKRAAII